MQQRRQSPQTLNSHFKVAYQLDRGLEVSEVSEVSELHSVCSLGRGSGLQGLNYRLILWVDAGLSFVPGTRHAWETSSASTCEVLVVATRGVTVRSSMPVCSCTAPARYNAQPVCSLLEQLTTTTASGGHGAAYSSRKGRRRPCQLACSRMISPLPPNGCVSNSKPKLAPKVSQRSPRSRKCRRLCSGAPKVVSLFGVALCEVAFLRHLVFQAVLLPEIRTFSCV